MFALEVSLQVALFQNLPSKGLRPPLSIAIALRPPVPFPLFRTLPSPLPHLRGRQSHFPNPLRERGLADRPVPPTQLRTCFRVGRPREVFADGVGGGVRQCGGVEEEVPRLQIAGGEEQEVLGNYQKERTGH